MKTVNDTIEANQIDLDTQQLQEKFEIIKSQAGEIIVQDDDTLEAAEKLMKVLKDEISEVDEILGKAKIELYEVYKKGMDRYNEQFKPREALKKELSKKCAAYRYKVEQIELKKAREAEAAEKKRLENLKIDDAVELENQGRNEEAESVLNAPISVAPAPIHKPKKTEGVSTRDNWKMRITNADMIPREYLIPNETLLNQMAKAFKNQKKIPGVEFYNEPISSVR